MKLIALFLLTASVSFGQNFFDPTAIQKIEIQFSQANWDMMLDTSETGDDNFTIAKSLKINGLAYDSVGVKWRGNQNFDAAQAKNPIHIELNTIIKGQSVDGQNDLYLNNGKTDPAFVREALSYQILGIYMDASRAGFAEVWVNGNFLGLYTTVEEVGGKFVKTHFGSSKGAFFKCAPENPSATNLSNLGWLGSNKVNYYTHYEKRAIDDKTWNELVDLCDTLNNKSSAVAQILDVDRSLWMLAANNVLVNLNSYTGGFSENYYVYRNEWGRFCPISWDLNESFGAYPILNAPIPLSISGLAELSPTAQETNSARPLIQKLLAETSFRKMYIAHFRTIFEEQIKSSMYENQAMAMQNLLAQKFADDPNKFYTTQQFQNSLTSATTSAVTTFSIPGLSSLMDARAIFLQNQAELLKNPPILEAPKVSNANPLLGSTVIFSVKTTNATAAWLGFRHENLAPFTRILMFDDGLHGDGAANDGTFGVSLKIDSMTTHFYVWSENAEAGAFSPARAEHEFYTLTAAPNVLAAGSVVINELMAGNTQTIADPSGQFDDWIELFNRTSNEINLSGTYLTNKFSDPTRWQFPEGTKLAANGYLLIWADGDTGQAGLHTNFKLTKTGDHVKLTDQALNPIDSVSFGQQQSDVAWARLPNGSGPFVFLAPTPGWMNGVSATTDVFSTKNDLVVFPNPTEKSLFFEEKTQAELPENFTLKISNSLGINVLETKMSRREPLDVSSLPSGIYFLKMEESRLVGRFLKI